MKIIKSMLILCWVTVALEIVWHLNRLPYLFTVNLIKNIILPKPISAKLFLNACWQQFLYVLLIGEYIHRQLE